MTASVLRLHAITKTFPGVVALDGVDLDVRRGEVHALLGENGAGKSTLMAVAGGATRPDQGTVEIGGQLLSEPSPAAALALGLAIVYQHTSVLNDLTVRENLVFAGSPGPGHARGAADARARRSLAEVGARCDPQTRVSELTAADRTLIEIAKALGAQPTVLVLDEPTESLSAAEADHLFALIRRMADGGAGVVFISHRIPEVRRIADRVTVLRDGRASGTMRVADVTDDDILRLIIGRTVGQEFPGKAAEAVRGAPLLEVTGHSGRAFRDVKLQVAQGEIVGLAGVEGNGQREFLRSLAGLVRGHGEVRVAGRKVNVSNPRRARRAGIMHLPGDRHAEGLFLGLTVRDNTTIAALRAVSRAGLVSRTDEERMVRSAIGQLAIKTPSAETPVAALSGGNQQKVLLARTLMSKPLVLLADEPTRGVDVGARTELYRILRDAAREGRAVVVLGSDAAELQGLCDRVLVFSQGHVVRELAGGELTEHNITSAAVTAETRHSWRQHVPKTFRLRRFLAGDYAPSAILALLIAVLTAYTYTRNPDFLNSRSVNNLLILAVPLLLASAGQLLTLLVGGIDLSVGPLMGLTAVVLSFFASTGQGNLTAALGAVLALAIGAAVGWLNAMLIRRGGLAPVLATVVSFIVLQGIALLLRPSPGGAIRFDLTAAVQFSVGPLPVAFPVAVALVLACEYMLRSTRRGIGLRAVGSDAVRAHRLGANVGRAWITAYVGCGIFAALGGIMLAAQTGIGDPSVGTEYTLSSITAVVLGGASVFGGRGSFLGAIAGAIFVQEVVTSMTFLDLSTAWQYWLPGLLILLAGGAYARARGVRTAALDATTQH